MSPPYIGFDPDQRIKSAIAFHATYCINEFFFKIVSELHGIKSANHFIYMCL